MGTQLMAPGRSRKPGSPASQLDDKTGSAGLIVLPNGRTNLVLRPAPARLRMRPGEVDAWDSGYLERQREFIERYGVPPIEGAAPGAWTFTNATRTNLLNGTHDLDSDSHKIALLASTSNIGASTTTFAGVTGELSTDNGYTSGGVAVTLSLSGTTTVTASMTEAQWEADGGDIVARFGCLYEVSGDVIAYCLLDSAPANVTATDGNTLTISAGGVLVLS